MMTGDERLYGRSCGRSLTERQKALLRDHLARLQVTVPQTGCLDLAALFPNGRDVWLEIGFGGGEHMVGQAMAHPDVGIVGAEPFLNGVVSALTQITEQGVDTARLHHGDARPLLRAVPDGALGRVFILFPDPWPKARHHKRRILSHAVVAECARALRPGGRLRFVTDWHDYAGWAVEHITAHPDFIWQAECRADWLTAPDDHIPTRYQAKALGDTPPIFLDFMRR